MRYFIILITILITNIVNAEVFNCVVFYDGVTEDEEKYRVIVDTGEKKEDISIITLNNKTYNLDKILIPNIHSIGGIYIEDEDWTDFYVINYDPMSFIDGFYMDINLIVNVRLDVSKRLADYTTLTIYNSNKSYLSNGMHIGGCEDKG